MGPTGAVGDAVGVADALVGVPAALFAIVALAATFWFWPELSETTESFLQLVAARIEARAINNINLFAIDDLVCVFINNLPKFAFRY